MAKYKVPSQAGSGADTFSDNLVGGQITTGTGQLTNTNFALDSGIVQRDTKNFKTNPFSDFLTLDDLKEENASGATINGRTVKSTKKEIKFNSTKNVSDKSLFGSLKNRLSVTVTNIIKNFPAGILIDKNSYVSLSGLTAFNSSYNIRTKTTTFDVEVGMLHNPYGVILTTPKSNTTVSSLNPVRDFYSSYKKYVIEVSGVTYNVTSYTEPNSSNIIKLTVSGNPFSGATTYNQNILIRPNNGVSEEFFLNLDDLESSLLNRETSPKYTASFKVPRDSFDETKTELTTVEYSWPVSTKDNWNLLIIGIEYDNYLRNLSDIADEIDDYKSNLLIRFLSSPQLFEFDSDGKKAEAVFQLYGQSFDKVKKYIDNIAFMRNVSYDNVNNLPDILLKNLSNTLGLDTVNLINESGIDELLYTKTIQYEGKPSGISLVEAEYEFYRRLLVNLAHIYKSKGTRKSIEFFLKFLGAPEPMIKIDQYVYKVNRFPISYDLEDEIDDVIRGDKRYTTVGFLPTGGTVNGVTYTAYKYYPITTTGTTSLDRDGYPVQELSFYPQSISGVTGELFFQKGSGWYDNTVDHKSPLIVDEEKSILTGRTKTVITKNSPFTYGEDYFNVYRTLPGLDTGYELFSVVDNVKGEILNDDSNLTLNRKNLSVYLSASQAVDYDIYRKSRDLNLTFGTNSLEPQNDVSFAEYVDNLLNQQILNSNLIKYKKNYIQLEDIFRSYITHTGFTPYNFTNVNEFINKMSPYWVQVLDQIIPATTLWTGGNLVENNIFGRSKYKHQYGCQPVTIIEDLYPQIPNNVTGVTDYFEYAMGVANYEFRFSSGVTWNGISFTGETNQLGEYKYDGFVQFIPVFDVDGKTYSGNTSSTDYYVNVSGYFSNTTGTTKNARLYKTPDNLNLGDFYDLVGGTGNIINPDYTSIKLLWKGAVSKIIDDIINTSEQIDGPGVINSYAPYTGATGSTSTKVNKKILSYNFFTDENGVDKIKLTSFKYGPNDCTDISDYYLDPEVFGNNDKVDCVLTGYTASYQMATPTPTPTPTITPTPTVTPTVTPTATPTSTPEPTYTPTPTPTITGTPTVTPTITPTPTVTPTGTPTPTPICVFDVDIEIITSTPTPTPTATPTCDFDVDIDIITSTPTPTPTATVTPTPTPNCNFDVDIDVITSTPTPTPTATPTCDFDVDVDIITSTPTPTPTPTVTPTPTPDCNFDVDIDIITSTPTPTPTVTVTPTPTLDCNFDVDIDVITSTPTPTPTPTVTPTPTPDCNFDVIADIVTSTPTPTPTVTITPTPTVTVDICIDCPEGYDWVRANDDTCTAKVTTSVTPPSVSLTAYTREFKRYSMYGTNVYMPGWSSNGTGDVEITLETTELWKNTLSSNTNGPWNGPLNRTGLWAYPENNDATDYPLNTWLGFTYCLSNIQGGQYYIGIAADNEFRLEIDGNPILDTYTNSGLSDLSKFESWHVYPVTLTAGNHIIGLYGYNLNVTGTNPAGFGCEIYNNTLSELINATSLNDLDVIFTSTNFVNQTIPVIKDVYGNYTTSGYTCPSGYEYAPCDGNCWKILTCPEITPTPTVTPTGTPTVTPTGTPTVTPTGTPTVTPTGTPTVTPTPTPNCYFNVDVDIITSTPTPTPTSTVTPTPTVTPTATPDCYFNVSADIVISTPTPTPTITPIPTDTPTPTPTLTSTPTVTPTSTPTVTPTSTPTVTPTGTPTVTPTVTPTATPLPCVCWTIYNEGGTTGNYTVTLCGGMVTSPNLLPGSSRSHCLQAGTYPIINSGLLTDVECGNTCYVSNECTYCGPTPTPTPTPTATPTVTPTPTPTATPCPVYGTLLYDYCEGGPDYNRIGVFAIGDCGSYTDVLVYNDETCGYIPPTSTPTPTPTATPLPPTYETVTLSPGGTVADACNSTVGSGIYYLPAGESFSYATQIFSTNTGTQADSGWYSNGLIAKQWDGSQITQTTSCDGGPLEIE